MDFKERDFFNELAFVTDSAQKFNIRTLTFCTFYSINRKEFLSFLKEKFQEDFVIIYFLFDYIYRNPYFLLK